MRPEGIGRGILIFFDPRKMKIENIEMKKCSKNLNRKSEINADMPVPAVSNKFVSINLVNRLHLA